MNTLLKEQISMYAKLLKLPTFAQYEDVLRQTAPDQSMECILLDLMKAEHASRQENQLKRRIRTARFPTQKTIQELDMSWFKNVSHTFIHELAACKYIADKQNIIMIGPPGTGKTHLAIGLGLEACSSGYKVLFKTAAALTTELAEARDTYQLSKLENSIGKADLLILDELSYLQFDRVQSEMLFQIISDRSERASTIVTTNLPFSQWTEMFENQTMVAALVDRLTFKSHLLDMNGDSYRLKSSMTQQ